MNRAEERDLWCMGRMAAGDDVAFAELFDRHSSVVLGVLARMVGDRAEAEEVLQDTFLQVWRQAGRFVPERGSPRSWLLMLARSRAIDRLRSREARRRREETAWREAGSGAGEDAAHGASRLEADERSSRVRHELACLPSEQRAAIELAFFEGLTHSAIAERLDAPLGTIKSRLSLGMSKLRRALTS